MGYFGLTMTNLEDKLVRYSKPSSDNERDKQDRAERMVRDAIGRWAADLGLGVSYVPKGSYANNTNVKLDSDVDIAVVHGNGLYYYDDKGLREEDRSSRTGATQPLFKGAAFRSELERVLRAKFGSACDATGKTAVEIAENTGRVKADVVPSFEHRRYVYGSAGDVRFYRGHIVFRTDGTSIINYPSQQYENGVAKNKRTGMRYKQLVRILKRLENDLVAAGEIGDLPSYFMECLVYCVPDDSFGHSEHAPLTDDLKAVLTYIWNRTAPDGEATNWYEPNGIKKLFATGQPWTMGDARQLTQKAWSHLGLG